MTTKTSNDIMEKLRSEVSKKPRLTTEKKSKVDPGSTNGGAQRLSITVYPADFARLNEIKHVMLREGIRVLNDSVAVRLAVRTVALDPTLLRKAYDTMILEDKRRS